MIVTVIDCGFNGDDKSGCEVSMQEYVMIVMIDNCDSGDIDWIARLWLVW